EQIERLVEALRRAVDEWSGLHTAVPSRGWAAAASISRTISLGLSGVRLIRTSNGASASSIAAATAAGEPIAPASPTPFMPPGMSGESVSWCDNRGRGTSIAVGGRSASKLAYSRIRYWSYVGY